MRSPMEYIPEEVHNPTPEELELRTLYEKSSSAQKLAWALEKEQLELGEKRALFDRDFPGAKHHEEVEAMHGRSQELIGLILAARAELEKTYKAYMEAQKRIEGRTQKEAVGQESVTNEGQENPRIAVHAKPEAHQHEPPTGNGYRKAA